jgi:hypothetical protein
MIELGLIGLCMLGGALLDQRDARHAAKWQRELDRVHHGTPIKPYDWDLEDYEWDRAKEYMRGHL